jgi:hypothetical protein
MSERTTSFTLVRFGLGVVQSITALFSGGAVIYGAHSLFLSYYIREWQGIQFAGVNGCAGTEQVVNGDLLEGETLCHDVVNYVPWIEMYRRHWDTAAIYYGVILLGFLVIGLLFVMLQRRLTHHAPFGEPTPAASLEASEHLT